MPIQPNLLERVAFFNLNAAPAPMLDLAGAIGFQALATAVQLNLFDELAVPASIPELVERLGYQQRGLERLLPALVGLGYLKESGGTYQNSAMTEKWFGDESTMDIKAAITSFTAFFQELFPHAPDVMRSGQRPFDFYAFTAETPGLSDAHQTMMQGNASSMGPDIAQKLKLPAGARFLDVGGGHGMFSIYLCEANPGVSAVVMDSAIALETAQRNVSARGLTDRIELCPADVWETEWGQDFDLVLLFNFIHHFDLETNVTLLTKAFDALNGHGRVAILDQLQGNLPGSALKSIVQLVGLMYYVFADGRVFSRAEIEQMTQQAGFGPVTFASPLQWAGTSLAVAGKA